MSNVWRRLRVHHGLEAPVMGEPAGKVAFASSDRQRVDEHFGMATGFVIHEVASDGYRLVEVLQSVASDSHSGRIGERVRLLAGCRLLFCVAIGEAAKQQLATAGITAMVVESGESIATLLDRLQAHSASHGESLTPFKKPLSSQEAEDKFLAMLANGWDE
ncbi:MAG: hypothetical protein HQL99_04275 [Magnetococcales bacterium]|nr:hypothetical protein [Magnetococcales bacterium]MBF0271823.1 hypothetical protein [Magnetococcales bacterium]